MQPLESNCDPLREFYATRIVLSILPASHFQLLYIQPCRFAYIIRVHLRSSLNRTVFDLYREKGMGRKHISTEINQNLIESNLNQSFDIINDIVSKYREFHVNSQKGQTPIHCACAEEHLEAVEVLIALGVNVDAQDHEGNTPLHVATRTRHTAIAQLLLRAGANTELIDEVNKTSL